MVEHVGPVEPYRERDHGVGEKGERQVLQVFCIPRVSGEDLQQQRDEREEDDHELELDAGEDELDRCRHRAEVSGDVEHIREEEERGHRVEHARGILSTNVRGEPLPAHNPYPRAHLLHYRHEGIGEDREPYELQPVARARLRVGSYPRGVVVCRASGEPRPKRVPVLFCQLKGPLTY